MSLSEFLLNKSYFKVKMHPIASNHFKIISKVNEYSFEELFWLTNGFFEVSIRIVFKVTLLSIQ